MRILGVGIATLDVISVVERYPTEDAEVRALERHAQRGGNCANSLAVLAQRGHRVDWVGTVADDADSRVLLAAAAREHVDTTHRVVCAGGRTPVSHVVTSRATGSRTIVHYRDLPELDAAGFARVPLTGIDWVHFEGRNVPALRAMLGRVRDFGTPCSLEVEKPREGIEALLDQPDLLLLSRTYARARGFATAEALLASLPRRPGQVAYCAWGDAGGWATDTDGRLHHSPAFAPAAVVDTLGAGDVFNAACIDGTLRGLSVAATLREACRLAGRKCGQPGLAGLGPVPGAELAVCRLEELADPGSRGFQLALPGGEELAGFVVRRGPQVHGYHNRCPHTGAPLEWRPHQFLDADGRFIQCALHGALFTPEDGRCVVGPCAGDALTPLPLAARDGWVCWTVPDADLAGRGAC
jgi:ketohexokinase